MRAASASRVARCCCSRPLASGTVAVHRGVVAGLMERIGLGIKQAVPGVAELRLAGHKTAVRGEVHKRGGGVQTRRIKSMVSRVSAVALRAHGGCRAQSPSGRKRSASRLVPGWPEGVIPSGGSCSIQAVAWSRLRLNPSSSPRA